MSWRLPAALLRLYPPGWQTRYGAEYTSLLADTPLGISSIVDVLLAALDAHLHPAGWSPEPTPQALLRQADVQSLTACAALLLTALSLLKFAEDRPGAVQGAVVVQSLALVAALLALVVVAPGLRRAWRRPEARRSVVRGAVLLLLIWTIFAALTAVLLPLPTAPWIVWVWRTALLMTCALSLWAVRTALRAIGPSTAGRRVRPVTVGLVAATGLGTFALAALGVLIWWEQPQAFRALAALWTLGCAAVGVSVGLALQAARTAHQRLQEAA